MPSAALTLALVLEASSISVLEKVLCHHRIQADWALVVEMVVVEVVVVPLTCKELHVMVLDIVLQFLSACGQLVCWRTKAVSAATELLA